MEDNTEPRISESSGTTNEALSDGDAPRVPPKRPSVYISEFDTDCYELHGDLVSRYFEAVYSLRSDIEGFYEEGTAEAYDFEPILIATGVEATVLEELPSLVGDSKVKCKVENSQLFITNLSNGNAHGAGVAEITRQTAAWAVAGGFLVTNDATVNFGPGSGRAPDLLLSVHPAHLLAGQEHHRMIVIELEIGNRSIPRMRADFIHYFDDPNIMCVVGIKMFVGEGRTPCQRALAVKWTRTQNAIISEDVCDFGILSISTGARASFSRVQAQGLTGVLRARWAARRFAPVPLAALNPAPPAGDQRAFVRSVARHVAATSPLLVGTLYGGVAPTFRFEGADLAVFLHNLPPATPALVDLNLDLGRVFHVITSTGPPV